MTTLFRKQFKRARAALIRRLCPTLYIVFRGQSLATGHLEVIHAFREDMDAYLAELTASERKARYVHEWDIL